MFHYRVPLSAAMMAFTVVATAGAACAGDLNDGGRVAMPLGLSAPAPGGFLEFCRRTPTQCMSSSSLSSANDTGDAAAVSRLASRMYWQNAFAKSAGSAPASTGSVTAPVSRSRATRTRMSARGHYDWSQAFAVQTQTASVVGPRRPEPAQYQPALQSQTNIAFSATDQVKPAVEADAGGISYQAASASEIRYQPTVAVPGGDDALMSARPFSLPSARSWALVQPVGLLNSAPLPNVGESGSRPSQVPDVNPNQATGPGAVIVLDRENWALLNRVNRKVNRQIRQASDQTVFGQADYWQAPTRDGAFGDCEDYVLAKRQALIEAGVPDAALSIAIVETRWGESHAVLLVAGDTGEVVLDSLSSWISRWDRVDYTWRERQAPGKVFEWVAITA